MDRIQAMQIFARVVEVHNFGKAAESLSLPPSTVTRVIKELETFLGVRLLQRTTRHLSLTPDGSLYYDHCRRLLTEIDDVESSFPGNAGRPKGKLRVDMSPAFARLFVLPSLKNFQTRYPDVNLTFTLGDRPVDLVQEGIDCVIRSGTLQDSASLVARRIASFEWLICASPEYIAQHGEPKNLEDLKQHHAVGFLSSRTGRPVNWDFVVDGEEYTAPMTDNLNVNDTDTYVACGLQGLGLIRIGSFMVLPHLRTGKLIRVLADYSAPAVPLSIMYPQNRHLSLTVRAFVDWMVETMKTVNLHASTIQSGTAEASQTRLS